MGIDDRILHSQAKRLLLQHYFFHLEGRSAVTVTDTSEGREPVFFLDKCQGIRAPIKEPLSFNQNLHHCIAAYIMNHEYNSREYKKTRWQV